MARIGNVALSALICLCLTTTMAPPLQASAPLRPAAQPAVGSDVVLKEGASGVVVGSLPTRYRNSLVVLEITEGKTRQEVGMGVSDQNGRVSMRVNIGGDGEHSARWRVIKNQKTSWTSQPFTLEVTDSKRKHQYAAEAATVFSHTQQNASAATIAGQARKPASTRSGPKSGQYLSGKSSEAGEVAETAAKSTGEMLGDFAKSAAEGAGMSLLGDGVSALFKWIFPANDAATGAEIAALTAQMQSDFAAVDQQLQQIESDLQSLSAQVSDVQSEVVQANASAAASSCNVVLAEANTYVSQIQDAFGNYQVVMNPQWVQANLSGASAQQGLKIAGNQIYGAGSGIPSFASGVVSLQNDVNGLVNTLTLNGAGGTNGIVGACASAISAGIVAQNANNTPGSVVLPGAVEESFYDSMHTIVSYYASWASLGQLMAARGGQMGVVMLNADDVSDASDVAGLCQGAAPSSGSSIISCAGIAYYTAQTQQVIASAWNLTGASWFDVSNGMLVGDARVDNTSDFIQPARTAWVHDIALYGQQTIPGIQGPTPVTLSSTSAATAAPAAGTTGLSSSNWLGLPFVGATTKAWDWTFPWSMQPTANNTGQAFSTYMANPASNPNVGLLNNGQVPSNLILYTGETSTFDIGQNLPSWITGPSQGTSFNDNSATAMSFIDTNAAPDPGANIVIGAPAGRGVLNSATYYMFNAPTLPSGVETDSKDCNIYGKECTYYAYNNTQNFYLGAYNNGAWGIGTTVNPTFYTPLTQTNTWSSTSNTGDGNSAPKYTYSNLSNSVTSWPTFMTATPQTQYLWPVVPLPAGGAAAPCTMTTFTAGENGNAGIGNVCQPMFQQWLAGGLGIDTGPVSITGWANQGTLTPSGNNAATLMVTNTSGSQQTVTIYADVTAGDAEVGSVVNIGSSSGDDANGASISNCTSNNGALQCSVTVQPGATMLNVPITGANGAATYSSGTLVTGLAGTGMYSSSTTQITPTDNGDGTVPEAVEGLTANTDTVSDSTALYSAVSWTVPTSSPVVTGYEFTITDPSGVQTTQTAAQGSTATTNVIVNNGYTAGATATVDLQLPSTQSGTWTIEVAAVNAAGVGPNATANAALGNSAPAAPTRFTATENVNGTITLTWNPVSAMPALSNYAIAITPPTTAAGTANTVKVVSNVPSYTIQSVDAIGSWSFSLTAVNSVGSSPAVVTTASITGIVPTQPQNLEIDVDAEGWVSAWFNASTSVPVADTYWVGLYDPVNSSPIASLKVSANNRAQKIRIRNFYQLGSNSPVGTWSLTVSPTNSMGIGDFAQSDLYVSQNLIDEVDNDVAARVFLNQLPVLLQQSAADSCAAYNWHPGMNVFGTCINAVFTPAATSSGGSTGSKVVDPPPGTYY